MKIIMATFLSLIPNLVWSEVKLACSFPTLPSIVMTYPSETSGEPTMSVENRAEQKMVVGAGSNRLETAVVDGYRFQFAPANSSLMVFKGLDELGNESGVCVRVGGTTNTNELDLSDLEGQKSEPLKPNDSPAEASVADDGNWNTSVSKSLLDDSTTVVLRLESNNLISKPYGGNDTATLLIRCKENTTVLYVTVAENFLSDLQGRGNIDYRVDEQPARVMRAKVSTDNKALGLWRGRHSIPVIERLLGAERLVMRVTPFSESPVEVVFNVHGLENAIKPLRAACNW